MFHRYTRTLSAAIFLLSIGAARADGVATYSGKVNSFSYSGNTSNDQGFVNVVFSSCSQDCGAYSMTISETDVANPQDAFVTDQHFNATIDLFNGEKDNVSGVSVGNLSAFDGGYNDEAWAINTTSWFHYINGGNVNGTFYPDLNFDASFTPNAIPEASTWTMMVIGFAGLGGIGYYRRKSEYRLASCCHH